MLYSVDSKSKVTKLPHEKEYKIWRQNITDDEYKKIVIEISKRMDGKEINTAGWIPGNDWTGTVFEPIYYACGKNKEESALFFGLIVFKLLMDDDTQVWGFGRYEKNGIPIRSMTYFPLNKANPNSI